MVFLVTGSSGYIGNCFCEYLCSKNVFFIGVDLVSGKHTSIICDLTNYTDLDNLLGENYDFIVDFAAEPRLAMQSLESYRQNWEIPKNLHRKFGNSKDVTYIFISSMLVSYNPSKNSSEYFYLKSKLLAENFIINETKWNCKLIIRPASVWGENSKIYRSFFLLMKYKLFLNIPMLSGKRYLIYDLNLVHMVYELALKDKFGGLYFGYDSLVSYAQISKRFSRISLEFNFLFKIVLSIIGVLIKFGFFLQLYKRLLNLQKDLDLDLTGVIVYNEFTTKKI